MRAHSGKLLCVALNFIVGVEKLAEPEEPVWVSVEGKEFSRKFRVC